jgi:FKBP-type peptidyl-prolyl cis-trans isomerase
MKNLSKSQSVAVFVSVAVVAYLLFGGQLMSFLNPQAINTDNQQTMTEENQQGIASQDIKTGEGDVAEAGDTLTVHYVGTLTDGRVFDSSVDRGTPFVFTLGTGQVIRGWDEGMEGMRVGGRRLLVLSPEYAYGASAVGSIPANSTLVFEVELLNVEKAR